MTNLELAITILTFASCIGVFLIVETVFAIGEARQRRAKRRADEQEEAAIVRLVGNPRRPSRRRD